MTSGSAVSPRLLVLSPSSDLYGSDRALLRALPALVATNEVTLVVAIDEPLVARASEAGATVIVLADFAARRRSLRPSALPALLMRSF